MANTTPLVGVDPRLRSLASARFPDSPALVDFLVEQMRVHDGSLDLLGIICGAVAELYKVRPAPLKAESVYVDRWRAELSGPEPLRMYEALTLRFPGLAMITAAASLRMHGRVFSVGNEPPAFRVEPRPSVNSEMAVTYLRLLFRTLAILERLERDPVNDEDGESNGN